MDFDTEDLRIHNNIHVGTIQLLIWWSSDHLSDWACLPSKIEYYKLDGAAVMM